MVILYLRWSRIRLWLFLGSILRVLFVRIMLTCRVGYALSHPLHLFWSGMCFVRLPLLLFFWCFGRVLIVSVGVSLVPKIFPLAYLVFFIWMLRLFLMSGASVDGFLLPLFFLSYSCVFTFTLEGFGLCFPPYVFILFFFIFYK